MPSGVAIIMPQRGTSAKAAFGGGDESCFGSVGCVAGSGGECSVRDASGRAEVWVEYSAVAAFGISFGAAAGAGAGAGAGTE